MSHMGYRVGATYCEYVGYRAIRRDGERGWATDIIRLSRLILATLEVASTELIVAVSGDADVADRGPLPFVIELDAELILILVGTSALDFTDLVALPLTGRFVVVDLVASVIGVLRASVA
jgi:hypothetical protein